MTQQRGTAAPARPAIGWVAAGIAVLLWSGWLVITRLGLQTTLAVVDLALLRYLAPFVLLAPVLWREGLALRRIGVAKTALMVGGAGLPFFLVSAAGIKLVPAAEIGVLLPGALPMFVALFSAIVLGERFTPLRLTGLALIAVGVAAIGGPALFAGEAQHGRFVLLAASAMWAVYTLALRRAGIGPWHAAALINTYSLLGFLPLALAGYVPDLSHTPWTDIGTQVLVQGVLTGLLANYCYALAVQHLGASRTAAFGAAIPVAVALIAIPVLGERPDALALLGIAVASVGTALASGAVGVRLLPFAATASTPRSRRARRWWQAESALDRYLAGATDLADLERRMRRLERTRGTPFFEAEPYRRAAKAS